MTTVIGAARGRRYLDHMNAFAPAFRRFLTAAGALTLLVAPACGGNASGGEREAAPAASAPTTPGGLTPFQIEHGIGPITEPVALGAIDQAAVKSGSAVFEQKCSACHKLGERYVGPALGGVTTRRSPAFVMNMVLNPQGMVEKHPETKKLLAEYFVAMPNQNLSPAEARQGFCACRYSST
jgi:mono/diheme cytochrome c family protein